MLRPPCPECGATVSIDEDDLKYFRQFYCDACGALLEVVDESPLLLGIAAEEPVHSSWEAGEDGADEQSSTL